MTQEEAKKIRKGDVLTIEVKANGMFGNSIEIDPGFGAPTFYVGPSAILSRTPAPREIKVGDVVTLGSRPKRYEVRAIDGTEAWIKRDGQDNITLPLADLRHADATEGHAND